MKALPGICRSASLSVAGLLMEGMRSLLRSSLGRSLQSLDVLDRLAAAWPVACGKAMANHATVAEYADGVVRLEAVDEAWMREMMGMKQQLVHELARISGVPVREMRIEIKRNRRQ